jgi:hypothetical protein
MDRLAASAQSVIAARQSPGLAPNADEARRTGASGA